jgi:hypothetical protein
MESLQPHTQLLEAQFEFFGVLVPSLLKLVASPAARVGERLASLWLKLPVVARGMQGEL